jgi:hypothetical protein
MMGFSNLYGQQGNIIFVGTGTNYPTSSSMYSLPAPFSTFQNLRFHVIGTFVIDGNLNGIIQSDFLLSSGAEILVTAPYFSFANCTFASEGATLWKGIEIDISVPYFYAKNCEFSGAYQAIHFSGTGKYKLINNKFINNLR